MKCPSRDLFRLLLRDVSSKSGLKWYVVLLGFYIHLELACFCLSFVVLRVRNVLGVCEVCIQSPHVQSWCTPFVRLSEAYSLCRVHEEEHRSTTRSVEDTGGEGFQTIAVYPTTTPRRDHSHGRHGCLPGIAN